MKRSPSWILDNTIVGAVNGVEFANDVFLTVDTGTDAAVRGNVNSSVTAAGIEVGVGATATVEANGLTDNTTGISVFDSGAVIQDSVIRRGRTGMHLGLGGSPTVEGNTVEGAEFGLIIRSGTTPTLVGNTICGNGRNLVLSGTAETPDTTGNEICEDAAELAEQVPEGARAGRSLLAARTSRRGGRP